MPRFGVSEDVYTDAVRRYAKGGTPAQPKSDVAKMVTFLREARATHVS